jgi:thioredoxin 1
LEPILQSVAQRIDAREKLYRVNVAIDQDLAADYSIEGTPTLVMFLDAREVGRVTGPHPTFSSVMTAVTRPFETEANGVAKSA